VARGRHGRPRLKIQVLFFTENVGPPTSINNTWILNNYGHEQPLTIPSLTVVGSGLRYSHGNGTRSPMPLTDMYLLQGGRRSHLPTIAALAVLQQMMQAYLHYV
jgi:hypothetical protein